MAFALSPSVTVKEIDLTGIVPAVDSTTAAIAGVFPWGPVDDRELVSSENELTFRFGKPTDDNYETFYSASNFLSYSNKLYVTRAADDGAKNAAGANTTIVAQPLIKNKVDYEIKASTLDVNAIFPAKWPGAIGNSLKVAVCASANAFAETLSISTANTTLAVAFAVNTKSASVTVTAPSEELAQTAVAALSAKLNVGDLVTAGNSAIGVQQLKVSTISGVTSNTAAKTATFTITTEQPYHLASNVIQTALKRAWEYSGLVDGAPATSSFTAKRGGSKDELHIVVIDKLGKFSGTPGTPLEVWAKVSRAKDALGEQGGSIYFKNVLNQSSSYIWYGNALPGVTEDVATAITPISVAPFGYSFSGGADTLSENAITLGDLARAYDQYKSSEAVDVSIIITGKSIGGANGEGLGNYIIDNIAETRKDCVVVISPALNDVVNNPYQEAEAIVEFRDSLRSTSYAILDSGYKYQYDRYNDKFRWIPLNADVAGCMARTDFDRDPWWSPAGFQRGNIKNVVKLAYNPDRADRDLIYKSGINPVVSFPGSGVILYGDKTLLANPSAFDRINVRRLFITLEKSIAIAAKTTLFEFNDAFTRAQFRNMIQPYLRDVKGRRGITDFKVVCDDTNNTGEVIDRNEFIGDIYVKPARSINYITLQFVAVRTDVMFDEVVGSF